ncbi:MAG: hypothetical protein AAF539_02545 [Planctomycetota bacterium]
MLGSRQVLVQDRGLEPELGSKRALARVVGTRLVLARGSKPARVLGSTRVPARSTRVPARSTRELARSTLV